MSGCRGRMRSLRLGSKSPAVAPEDKHRVMSTEGEGVGHRCIHGRGTRLVLFSTLRALGQCHRSKVWPCCQKGSGHSRECPVASFVYISRGVYRSNPNLLCRDSISTNSPTSWFRPYNALPTDRASTIDLPDSISRMEPHH